MRIFWGECFYGVEVAGESFSELLIFEENFHVGGVFCCEFMKSTCVKALSGK